MNDDLIKFDIICENATGFVSLSKKDITMVGPVLEAGRMFARGARSVIVCEKEDEEEAKHYFLAEKPEQVKKMLGNFDDED